VAHQFRTGAEQWCLERGLSLSISNEGHHWKLQGTTLLAEWWPSSAKLVFDKQYERGIHCHDIEQLTRLVDHRRRRRDD
jgi:hypothetical protein